MEEIGSAAAHEIEEKRTRRTQPYRRTPQPSKWNGCDKKTSRQLLLADKRAANGSR